MKSGRNLDEEEYYECDKKLLGQHERQGMKRKKVDEEEKDQLTDSCSSASLSALP